MINNFILSVFASTIVAVGAFALTYAIVANNQTEAMKAMKDAVEAIESVSDGESFAAASGPDMPFRYLNVGGVKTFYNYSNSLIQATSSVLCSIQSPAGTSTLQTGGILITTGTSSATSLSATKSTTRYGVGTVIASSSVASGARATLEAASSTASALANDNKIFPPNSYLVFAQQGGGILNQEGSCFAEFVQF